MRNHGRYILNGKQAVPCEDLSTWCLWIDRTNRRVAEDFIGEVRVCTVFLGLDLNEDLAPLELFETMIYGGPHDRYYMRYATWDEAEAGHKIAVALCHATNHSGAGLSRPMLKLRSKQGTYDGQH